jgi:formylmethanofuran dehydrogenase subunit A
VSEEIIKVSDGSVYDVTDVTGDKTDIVIIKKDGKIVEEQITQADKVRILYNINHRLRQIGRTYFANCDEIP